jgi:DNA modification methylase
MDEQIERVVQDIPENIVKIIRKNNSSHIFINGDSLKILKNFPDNSIDLIITDPLYNVGLDYGHYCKDKKSKDEYFTECGIWLKESARVLSKTGSFYLISYPEINARLLPFIEDELKLKFKRWITWHYPTNIGHSKRNFTRTQRAILFFTKSNSYVFNREHIIQHYKNPEVKKIKERIEKGSKGRTSYDLFRVLDLVELSKGMIDVFDFNLLKNVCKDRIGSKKYKDKYHHPCQLPLALLKIFVKVSSNPKDILLDPFAGTFTLSAVAAELQRNSIGVEINPNYVKLGLERLKK